MVERRRHLMQMSKIKASVVLIHLAAVPEGRMPMEAQAALDVVLPFLVLLEVLRSKAALVAALVAANHPPHFGKLAAQAAAGKAQPTVAVAQAARPNAQGAQQVSTT